MVCVGALVAARWHHEREVLKTPRTTHAAWLARRPLEAREAAGASGNGSRLGWRLPAITYPLYWLGLTSSAALAAQAISLLVLGAAL